MPGSVSNYSEYVIPQDGGAIPPITANITMNGGALLL